MKIFNILFGLLFLISAGLQYNDPDPYVWIPIYLYAAILCWLAASNKFYLPAFLIGIVVYAAYALYLFFTKDGVLDWIQEHNAENIAAGMQATKPWIEETREFFGLLITIIVLGVNYFYAKRRVHSA
jgi:Ca2+/Na+ antiporter